MHDINVEVNAEDNKDSSHVIGSMGEEWRRYIHIADSVITGIDTGYDMANSNISAQEKGFEREVKISIENKKR